jgi:hypothetical protein
MDGGQREGPGMGCGWDKCPALLALIDGRLLITAYLRVRAAGMVME